MVRSVYQPRAGESTITIMPERHLVFKNESCRATTLQIKTAEMQLRMPKMQNAEMQLRMLKRR